MPGTVNGTPLQGGLYMRDVVADYSTFAGGITEAEFETGFPAATTLYYDAADGQELTAAAAGTYVNAQGGTVNVYSEMPLTFNLVGLTETEYDTLVAKSGSQQDIAIKSSVCGENSLGSGIVFRDYNIHVGEQYPIGGVIMTPITATRKYPAKIANTVNQRFNIDSV